MLETAKEVKTIPLDSQVYIIVKTKVNGAHVSPTRKESGSLSNSIIKMRQYNVAKIGKKIWWL